MADPKSEDSIRERAEQLEPELIDYIRKPLPKKRGRPQIDDSVRLSRMAILLASRAAQSERQAARMVAKEDPGHSERSTGRRLRRNYAKDREQLKAQARGVLLQRQEAGARRQREVSRVSRAAPQLDTGRNPMSRGGTVLSSFNGLSDLLGGVADYSDVEESVKLFAALAKDVTEQVQIVKAVMDADLQSLTYFKDLDEQRLEQVQKALLVAVQAQYAGLKLYTDFELQDAQCQAQLFTEAVDKVMADWDCYQRQLQVSELKAALDQVRLQGGR